MPRAPSGKTTTHSSFSSMWTQFSGVPTIAPIRTMPTPIHGSRGMKYSPIERQIRGGSASRSMATLIIAPSKGS